MKRKFLGIALTLSFAIIVLATGVAPAFAQLVPGYDHVNAGGSAVISIAGQPQMQINVAHFDEPTSHGVRDSIDIRLLVKTGPLAGAWVPVVSMLDNPEVLAWQELFNSGGAGANNIILVKPWQIQVWRVGKTVFTCWTEPLKASITGNNPMGVPWAVVLGVSSVTLPPGCLLLQGYGCAIPVDTTFGLPNGIFLTMKGTTFNAKATLACPAWHYCGPVGDPSTPSTMTTDMMYTQSFVPS
jgi:hypothetical protein